MPRTKGAWHLDKTSKVPGTFAKLSVLIPCFNSASVIRPALESVRWADEILAVDSGSTDLTHSILKEFGAKILAHEYLKSAENKNTAIAQCSHDWILILDSDESFDEETQNEIRELIQREQNPVKVCRFARKNFVYGKWLKHGGLYPDYQVRLFRRGEAWFETGAIHETMKTRVPPYTLKGSILHNGFKNVSEWLAKASRYSLLEAKEMRKAGRRFSLFRFLIYPPVIFLRDYFIRRGFLDGTRGLLMAVLSAVNYALVFARLYEEGALEN